MSSDTFDFQDGNGPVPAHRHQNPNGVVGGWVADTAWVHNSVYVDPSAMVYDRAIVSGMASVLDDARVYGDASVYDDARVMGHSKIHDQVRIYDAARVVDVEISGNAEIYGLANVGANGWAWGEELIPSTEDQQMLAREIVRQIDDAGRLDMSMWHSCSSSHCIAGWCQVIVGDTESDDTAYAAGVRHLPALAPYFFSTSDDDTLRRLRQFAETGEIFSWIESGRSRP